MSFKGTQRECYNYWATSVLERNRLVTLNLSTDVASLATYGSKVQGITSSRGAETTDNANGYKINVYPVASRDRTLFVTLASAATKGAKLFPVANGYAVASSYTAGTRSLAAEPTPGANATYLLPAAVTGTNWTGHANAVAIYTHVGTTWAFVDVSSTANLGLTVYVTDEKRYYTWNGSAWVRAYSFGIADDSGSSGADIPAINIDTETAVDGLDSNANIFMLGQYSGTASSTTVTILDARIAAGDKVFCQFQGGTSSAYVVSAVATAGTLTLTLSAASGANTRISYIVVRSAS